MEELNYIKILKALSTEERLEIFKIIRCGEICACNILSRLKITQPTLSHHMKILSECGLVLIRKDWKWTYYSINEEVLENLLSFLSCCRDCRS